MNLIKVGFLVSYDYAMLREAIPRVYSAADSIALAIDKYRRTWSGNTINIPEEFFAWIKEFDTSNKISIYEDDFYVPELSTKANDTRERNMLAKFMGEGGWHVQVDSDEYFADFPAFCAYLRSLQAEKPVSICPLFVTLFKKLDNGYLYVSGNKEYYPVATNFPVYNSYRSNSEVRTQPVDHLIIHDSWARTEEEMRLKLINWSHNADFDVMSYYRLWQAIDKGNYRYVNDFHPISRKQWRYLSFLQGDNIGELFLNLDMRSIFDSFKTDIELAAEQPLWGIVKEKLRRRFSK